MATYKKIYGWLFVLIGAVGALVLLGSILFARPHGKHKPGSLMAAAHDEFPHTLAELNAWYAEPEQNAATFYLQGFNALHITDRLPPNLPLLAKGKLPPLGASMPAPVKSAMAAIVHSNRDALQFFAQGAKYEQSRYPLDLGLGFDACFPHLPHVKGASRLVELSAILHAEARDGKRAADDVLVVLGLAR